MVLVIIVEQSNNGKQQINDKLHHNETIINEPNVDQTQGIVLRRSHWKLMPTILNNCVINLWKSVFGLGGNKDLVLFSQAMESNDSTKWINAIKIK